MAKITEQKKGGCFKTPGSDHQTRYSFQRLEQKPHGPQTPRPLNYLLFSPIYSSYLNSKSFLFSPLNPAPPQIYLPYNSSLKHLIQVGNVKIRRLSIQRLKFFLVHIRNLFLETCVFFKTQKKRPNRVTSETTYHRHF